jgi:hypothetical protein
MKQISRLSVQTVMDLLIHTNGNTSTLEVKTELQHLGYFATQSEVKAQMDELYDASSSYNRTTSNNYFVYTFGLVRLSAIGLAADYIDPTMDDDDDDDDDDDNTFTPNAALVSAVNNFKAKIVSPTTSTDIDRDPLFIYYVENQVKNHNGDDLQWVVFHTDGNNEFHIYNENISRDLVRSKYSSLLKCKNQDVRAKRLCHFR